MTRDRWSLYLPLLQLYPCTKSCPKLNPQICHKGLPSPGLTDKPPASTRQCHSTLERICQPHKGLFPPTASNQGPASHLRHTVPQQREINLGSRLDDRVTNSFGKTNSIVGPVIQSRPAEPQAAETPPRSGWPSSLRSLCCGRNSCFRSLTQTFRSYPSGVVFIWMFRQCAIT